jgi:hypothetical protein
MHVQFGVCIQHQRLTLWENYFNCTVASFIFYALGHLFMALNMPRTAAYAHASIHVVANAGNIALQRGSIASVPVPNGFANRETRHV